ncbi:hypothetical protein BH23PAT2_BH23PAT2_05680 [soil metagenome]
MATYKVIQDIEAEDKLFGPLTLKQFIFACITVFSGYLCFWSLINNLAFLLVIFLPPTLFFGLLAFPWSKEQSTEVWMMAKLRFFFRPRLRIWDQVGTKELVTITVPKHEEKHYTDGLSNVEVRSRLKTLASTIDSRGWAIKNADINVATQASYLSAQSDRLVQSQNLPHEVASFDVGSAADMLDEQNNPEAQRLDQMIQKSQSTHRDQLLGKISQSTISPAQGAGNEDKNTQNDYWFMRQPDAPQGSNVATFGASPAVNPGAKAEQQPSAKQLSETEKKLLDKIHKQKNQPNPTYNHMKRISPLSEQDQQENEKLEPRTKANQPAQPTSQETAKPPVPETAKADILVEQLSRDNNRSVESLSREANQVKKNPRADEVVVSLH